MNSIKQLPKIDRLIHAPHTPWVGGLLALIIPLGFLLLLIPLIGEIGASHIPREWENSLGDSVLRELESSSPTKNSRVTQTLLQERTAALAAKTNLTGVKLHFISGEANALALPGNNIVITDDLLKVLENADQIDAVIAHELGHLQERHNMKAFFSSGLLSMLIQGMTGDFLGETAITDLFKKTLIEPAYSRKAEIQADAFAFDLLIKTRRSPEHFALGIEKLAEYIEGLSLSEGSGVFSSHPPSLSRAAAARKAAKEAGFAPLANRA